MKWIWAIISIWVVPFVMAVLNLIWRKEIVECLTSRGWNELAGIASGTWWQSAPAWLVALAAILTLTITIHLLIQARISTNAQLAVGLFQEFHSEAKLKTLHRIYHLKPPVTPQDVECNCLQTIENEDNFNRVLNQLDTLGALVKHKIIQKHLAVDGYGGATALRCWCQLRDYIKSERNEKQDTDYGRRGSNYLENLQYLVTCTLEYANKKYPKGGWIKFQPGGEGNKIIDLVAELNGDPGIRPKNAPKGKRVNRLSTAT